MKGSFIFFLLTVCFCSGSFGQDQNALSIALLANEHTTTTIFFPSAISKFIDPSANYKFEYQNDVPSIGLLKGRKGSPSNLTVITDDGYIYSFSLNYSEKIENFNFMLTVDMAVGRIPNRKSPSAERVDAIEVVDTSTEISGDNTVISSEPNDPTQKDSDSDTKTMAQKDDDAMNIQAPPLQYEEPFLEGNDESVALSNGEGDLYDLDRDEYYRIYCENNYLQKTVFRRTFRQNKRVVLKLNNILVDREEIYFILQVENNSRKEYQVNGLSFFRKSGVGQLQNIMKPLYTFNLQDKIDPQSINEIVFVFKGFSISNKEEVYVVLDELENDRMVVLPLDNSQINAPTN